MGEEISYFECGTPGRTDDPDPVTGLTSRDKYLITSSYDRVRPNATGIGVAVLNLLFKNHPEYLKLFPFKDIPVKDLPANKKYQAHGSATILAFSSVVNSLDDNDLLVINLSKIGESHVLRNITEQQFLNLKDILLEIFSSIYNAAEMAAWKKAVDVAFPIITKPIRDEQNKK